MNTLQSYLGGQADLKAAMGQQQSLAARGTLPPGVSTRSGEIRCSVDDNSDAGGRSRQLRQESSNGLSTSLSIANSLGGSVSATYAADIQTKSVRAAIDTFIENCLAGNSEICSSSGRSNGEAVEEAHPASQNPSETKELPDHHQMTDGGNTEEGNKQTKLQECSQLEENVIGENITHEGNKLSGGKDEDHKNFISSDNKKLEVEKNVSKDYSGSPQNFEKGSRETASVCQTACDGISTSLTTTVLNNSKTKVSMPKSDILRCTSDDGSKVPKAKVDNPNNDKIMSVCLKTIIDHVLDNSLGANADLKPIPPDQCILPQLAADEKNMLAKKSENSSAEASSNFSTEGKSGDRVEPVAVCFMDHIEKAVERSFSSITEEEERKEKERAIAARSALQESTGKPQVWNSHGAKTCESVGSGSSAGDSTISVQDIVDRVISQTEVISKLMTTTSTATHHTEAKITATSSGTFYPSRSTADCSSTYHSQSRRECPIKDDTIKDAPPVERRRGRPRMRSPYLDSRDSMHQECSSSARGHPEVTVNSSRRGSNGGVPCEDYLHSMKSNSRFGQTPVPSQALHHFLPGSLSSAAASPASFMTSAVNVHPAVVVTASAGIPTASNSLHLNMQAAGVAPLGSLTGSQPPLLVRVEHGERFSKLHGQQQHAHMYPPHQPSRNCSCTACVMYFSREVAAGGLKHGQTLGESNIPRLSPHSPHIYTQKTASQTQSSKYGPFPNSSNRETRKPDKVPHPQSSMYPQVSGSQSLTKMYASGHRVCNVQPDMPLYSDSKHSIENPHLADAYPMKHPEISGYYNSNVHLSSFPSFEKPSRDSHIHGSESGIVRVSSQFAGDRSAISHIDLTPHHLHHEVKPSLADGPVLDLTVGKDPSQVACLSANFEEDDKPLDLSKKPSVFSGSSLNRQDMRQPSEVVRQGMSVGNGTAAAYPDSHGTAAKDNIQMHAERWGDSGMDSKFVTGSQHLHNLETSVENYFHKLQHHNSQFQGATPPNRQSTLALLRPLSHGALHHPAVSGDMSMLSHHPSHVPSAVHHSQSSHQQMGYKPAATSSIPPFSSDPVLSPTGNRRPQLRPIPSPNVAAAQGTVVSSIGNKHSPCWTGGNLPNSSSSPKSYSGQQQDVTTQNTHGSTNSNLLFADSGHSSGSRSVSPPSSEQRGDDRRRGSISKHEPIQNIIGHHNPTDILFLICRLCRQTYGSPYGFRRHFRNQHGFEPKSKHTIVQTISATKNARQQTGVSPMVDGDGLSEDSCQSYCHHSPSADSVGHSQHGNSPRPDMGRIIADGSPRSASSESSAESPHPAYCGDAQVHPSLKSCRGTNGRSNFENKLKSGQPSSLPANMAEDREDTKCLECPECGQTFQLNDFGSYKRHCRQHGQTRGMAGNVGPGLYTCTDCQCAFPEIHLLKEHVMRHETQIASVVCHVCHLPFLSAVAFQEHARTVHSLSTGLESSVSPVSSNLVGNMKAKSGELGSAVPKSQILNISARITAAASPKPEIKPKLEPLESSTGFGKTGFNLTVSTPSNLEVKRLPADPIVTSASPDSSSDKKAIECIPVSSSSPPKRELVKQENSEVSVKRISPALQKKAEKECRTHSKVPSEDDKDSGYIGDNCPSNESRSLSSESSLASPMESEEGTELYHYKHKKFGAHRKRVGSNDISELESKVPRQDRSGPVLVSSVESSNTLQQSNTVQDSELLSSVSAPQPDCRPEVTDKSLKSLDTGANEKAVAQASKTVPSKTEARHQMPFVWDRVTRSQAGKNACSADYS